MHLLVRDHEGWRVGKQPWRCSLTMLANTDRLKKENKPYTNIEDRGESVSVEKMLQRKGDPGSI